MPQTPDARSEARKDRGFFILFDTGLKGRLEALAGPRKLSQMINETMTREAARIEKKNKKKGT